MANLELRLHECHILLYRLSGSKAAHNKFSHVSGLTLDLPLRDFEDFANGRVVSVARLL